MDIVNCTSIPIQVQSHYQRITSKLESLRLLSPRLTLQIYKPTEIQQEILKLQNLKTEIGIYLQSLCPLRVEEQGRTGGDHGGNFFRDSIASLTLHAVEKEIQILTEILDYDTDLYTRKVMGVLYKYKLKCEKRKIEKYQQCVKSRYTITGKLGRGACSYVLKAQHNELKTIHAIKVTNPSTMNAKQQMRITREILINSMVQHKNIVNITEIYQTKDQISFVMELCSGGDLFDFVVSKNGSLTEDQAKCYITGVLEAVHYLHSLNIAHRDLKPENLVFDKEGDGAILKIIDLGFAKEIQDVGGLATPIGSLGYYPKETIHAIKDLKLGSIINPYTPQVDMWAIGCIVYFMLFGTPPFKSKHLDPTDREIEILKEVERARYKFPDDVLVSEEAKDFISHLLQKEPAKRMTSLEALNHPWIRRKPLSPPSLIPPNSLSPRNPIGEPEINILRKSVNDVIDAECKNEDDEDIVDCGLVLPLLLPNNDPST